MLGQASSCVEADGHLGTFRASSLKTRAEISWPRDLLQVDLVQHGRRLRDLPRDVRGQPIAVLSKGHRFFLARWLSAFRVPADFSIC